jgi:hypothetical protein
MLRLGKIISSLRGSVVWTLLLLLGPAPVAPLFLAAVSPMCQMECCKRARHCICNRHGGVPSFDAASSCESGCSRVSGAPQRSDAATCQPPSSVVSLLAADDEVSLPFVPAIPSATSPFLRQRPPPQFAL